MNTTKTSEKSTTKKGYGVVVYRSSSDESALKACGGQLTLTTYSPNSSLAIGVKSTGKGRENCDVLSALHWLD